MSMFILLFVLGTIGGFLSGLLGLGGAVIMIPMMLYLPPLFNAGSLDMQSISGLSMIQVFFASLSGVIRHKKNNYLNISLLLIMGLGMLVGSGIGSTTSKFLDNNVLLFVFGLLTLLATIMMLFPAKQVDSELEADYFELKFNKPLAFTLAVFVGILSGMVGAGGGFVLIPIMIYILKIPIKITIGTSIGVVLVGAIVGAMGKAFTGQIDGLLALPLILSSIPFAQLGGIVSKRTSPRTLKILLLIIIIITCLKVWQDILIM